MNAFEQVALAWQAVSRTFRQLASPATWWPWLPLGALQAVAIALVWNVAHPLVSPFLAPLVRRLAGDGALHYPALFAALPGLYARLDLAIGALVGPVAVGAATRLFERRFLGRPAAPGAALAEALRRSPALIAAQLPLHLLAIGLGMGLGGWLDSHPRTLIVRLAGGALVTGGTLLAQTLLFYVAPLVVLERRSPLAAFAALPRTWRAGGWSAFTLSAFLLAALTPFQMLVERAAGIAERGLPELVGVLTAVQAGFTLLLWYLLAGSATLVYLAAEMREAGGEERP